MNMIKVDFVAQLAVEHQAFAMSECINLTSDDEKMLKEGKTPLDVLRAHIADFLTSRKGWEENVCSCEDVTYSHRLCFA